MSKFDECFNSLEDLAKTKGYLLFDEILDATEALNLSIVEVDNLSEKLQLNGIVISNEPPESEDQQIMRQFMTRSFQLLLNSNTLLIKFAFSLPLKRVK